MPPVRVAECGIVRMSNKNTVVTPTTISQLYQHHELYLDNELIGEDILNLDRDT
jgi:hypothetical protein